MNAYRFRAECIEDLHRLSEFLPATYLIQPVKVPVPVPDVEVLLKTTLSLYQVREKMLRLEDGHVMAGTLNYSHRYTGERFNEKEWTELVPVKFRSLPR